MKKKKHHTGNGADMAYPVKFEEKSGRPVALKSLVGMRVIETGRCDQCALGTSDKCCKLELVGGGFLCLQRVDGGTDEAHG